MLYLNNFNQPVGISMSNWIPAKPPSPETIIGQYCRLEKLDPKLHARDLFDANQIDSEGVNWTYLPYGPISNFDEYNKWLEHFSKTEDPYFFSIIDLQTGKAVGVAAYMMIDPAVGSIEIGHLNFSPLLQKKIAATEAMYLLMNDSFERGYRRYVWRCNSLNEPSRLAAIRLGFQYEGTFRNATIFKGHSRNTDWFSILDSEWPRLKMAFNAWLAPGNFDKDKRQLKSLRELFKKMGE